MVQPLLREVYGRLLRRMRQQQGRTLAEVAAEAGISMAYLSEIERGLKEPSSEILAAVCGALDATIVGLVGAASRGAARPDGRGVPRGACSTSPRAEASTRALPMVQACGHESRPAPGGSVLLAPDFPDPATAVPRAGKTDTQHPRLAFWEALERCQR